MTVFFAELSTLLLVLFGRSVLFLIACLPVVIAWQGSRRTLWLSLGFALFVLVGLLYMLMGHWLPLAMRTIHSLEILVDSLVYAGALVWLLSSGAGRNAAKFSQSAGEWVRA